MPDHPALLEGLLQTSGVSVAAFARTIGSDRTRVDDWLARKIAVPRTMHEWIENAVADAGSIQTRVGELEVLVRRTGPRRRP